MSKQKLVGVIGAGIFGCITAIELSRKGYQVQIYEKTNDIFSGATSNTQNRLHLGLHYPRDHETAVQSRLGFRDFLERFPTCVRMDFPNYYGVAKERSKVSTKGFEDFAKKAGIQISRVNFSEALLPNYDHSRIDSIWECHEGVIDIDLLKIKLLTELEEFGVQVFYNTEVIGVEKKANKFEIYTAKGEHYVSDFMVRATYGLDNIKSVTLNMQNRNYEFHRTLILEAEMESKPFGFTVIDGDFFTILPKGFSGKFLLYGPSICVLERNTGNIPPEDWSSIDYTIGYLQAEKELKQRIKSWMPNLEIGEVNKWNTTIRTILPNVSATDKRVSRLLIQNDRFVDIWSGKMDHSLEIARQTLSYFDSRI